MINRPMLLNLFKKASTPKNTISEYETRAGLIPVYNYTLGSAITLKSTEMRAVFAFYKAKRITRVFADFVMTAQGNQTIPILAVMQPYDSSQSRWRIYIPKDNILASGGVDVYLQRSSTSNVFEKQ